MCICPCISLYVSVYVCMYVCMHVCMHVCVYVCMRVCMYVYVCMYVCMYVLYRIDKTNYHIIKNNAYLFKIAKTTYLTHIFCKIYIAELNFT